MSLQEIHIIRALSDNYVYLIEGGQKRTVIVDPGEATPVIEYIERANLLPETVLLTHHHADHIGGVAQLTEKYDLNIIGPEEERGRLPFITQGGQDGDEISLAPGNFRVISTPGHTLSHICFYCEEESLLFSGDTLFSIGCGRVFEGTMTQMYTSLGRLKALPNKTRVYCGHEYTAANIDFALRLCPDSAELEAKKHSVMELLRQGKPTIPSILGDEKELNPFLSAPTEEEFAQRRRLKDEA